MEINKDRLLNQLKKDEGFISHAKWDIKQWSYGYGCRAPGKDATITEPEAAKLLQVRMEEAIEDFKQFFEGHLHKFNDVRAEAFINMIFNMGTGNRDHPERGGLGSFKNTLGHIFDYEIPDWGRIAYNLSLSKWYRQVGNRAVRICKEVKTGVKV